MSVTLAGWAPDSALASQAMVEPAAHKGGMRQFAAGVTIITTVHGDERAGLTATAMVSVTADPPRLMVFINKNVLAADIMLRRGALGVNVLAAEQEDIAKAFAGMIPDVHGMARFNHGAWDTLVTGSPMLSGALASFDTRVIGVTEESTHYACLCEVLAARETPGLPLLYFNGAFHQLP